MKVRAAIPEDAAVVAALWNVMIRETLSTFTTVEKSRAEVQALIETRAATSFVAEKAGQFAGFATFGPFRSGPGYIATVEHTVLVDARQQGAGVGRMLMAGLEAAARQFGCHVMVAGISNTNTGAQKFHKRLGFTEVGRMPQVGQKAGQWLDLVLMQKIL
ncbi:GNAT family N-acetyltransferase [uncultured Roseobacter sp.]|uniref:GNAT family N-acetyltransferase n=1 Tax=uncultured Roseobacter sp. TaxID=114847 RepID=UPI002627D37F|nr:GNAT family N-acetyltransferase [uncultured Roseobacter sp.]